MGRKVGRKEGSEGRREEGKGRNVVWMMEWVWMDG